jgi:DNA mismatch endonuclease, patch repair protein
MDVHDTKTRSYNMSQIRGKNTKPEMIVRSYLHANGYRFRLHDKTLPGTPDIVLKKYKTVIDVRGCFWHRHKGCKNTTTPKTRTQWWNEKFSRTVERDKKNQILLESDKWVHIVLWECEIKNYESLDRKLQDVIKGFN